MKKATILLAILMIFITGRSFSQEKNDQDKTQIRPALLVIDIQNAYLKSIPDRDREVGLYYINALIDLFRSHGLPVIRVYHSSKEYGVTQGIEEFEFPASVKIKPEDPRVIKTYPDAFNKTDLDKVIRDSGSNTLFLCGLSAVGCVLATYIGAENHDYKAFFVKDAIMSHNTEYTRDVEQIFDATGFDLVKMIVESSAR